MKLTSKKNLLDSPAAVASAARAGAPTCARSATPPSPARSPPREQALQRAPSDGARVQRESRAPAPIARSSSATDLSRNGPRAAGGRARVVAAELTPPGPTGKTRGSKEGSSVGPARGRRPGRRPGKQRARASGGWWRLVAPARPRPRSRLTALRRQVLYDLSASFVRGRSSVALLEGAKGSKGSKGKPTGDAPAAAGARGSVLKSIAGHLHLGGGARPAAGGGAPPHHAVSFASIPPPAAAAPEDRNLLRGFLSPPRGRPGGAAPPVPLFQDSLDGAPMGPPAALFSSLDGPRPRAPAAATAAPKPQRPPEGLMGHAADSGGWDSRASSLDAPRLQGRSPVLMHGPPAHSTVSELDFVSDLVSEAGPSPPHLNHPIT
jgi:hypothetical protein